MSAADARQTLARGLAPGRQEKAAGPRIGLALGGGGARGLAHVVICEAFDELGLRPAAIAGTSIGAAIGASYAAGMSGAEMREFVLATFRDRGEVFARLWRLRNPRFTEILAPALGNPAQLNAEKFLAAFLPDVVPETFDELAIPFTAVASDFYGWTAVGFGRGTVRPAVAASMAIPMMFRPVMVDGRVMVDGGVTDPLPTGFLGEDVDLVVAVDVVNGPRGDATRIPSPYEAIFGATQLLMQAVVAEKIAKRPPDILVRPNISIFRVLDFLKARAILRASEPAKDEMKRQIEAALERVAS